MEMGDARPWSAVLLPVPTALLLTTLLPVPAALPLLARPTPELVPLGEPSPVPHMPTRCQVPPPPPPAFVSDFFCR